jgi:hypothetical protein
MLQQSPRPDSMPLVDPRNAPQLRDGKVRPMILLWALGIPIPLILLIVLIRGCMA